MPVHVIHIGNDTYLTTSHTLATDFGAWGYTVDTCAPRRGGALALFAVRRAEEFDQRRQESELMDIWCAEWVGRWGFEARVGAMLSEREELGKEVETDGRLDPGAAVGAGRNNFTEGARAVKAGGGRAWRYADVRRWFGGGMGMGMRSADEMDVEVRGDQEDVLPLYTRGEDPPRYEQ